MRSQIVTSCRGGTRYAPMVFTEQGVAMLSSVLRSRRAIQVNIQIMRAFTRLRQMPSGYAELRNKIEKMEEKYDQNFQVVFAAIKQLEEWKKRAVKGEPEYAILTAEISKAAFGLAPSEYKQVKGLKRQNLHGHMNDLELIFSMLGEAASSEITRKKDARGLGENKTAARKGGRIAGAAREKLEAETGSSVVSSENYLAEPEKTKRLKGKKS